MWGLLPRLSVLTVSLSVLLLGLILCVLLASLFFCPVLLCRVRLLLLLCLSLLGVVLRRLLGGSSWSRFRRLLATARWLGGCNKFSRVRTWTQRIRLR